MSIGPGTHVDRYEVVCLLGAGGMGEVYRALDTRLDRHVAVKLLPPAFAADATRMRRFIREAKAASALNHPNILIVHEIGESGEQPFIVTEFIDGVTLRRRLAEGPCPLPVALEVAIQVTRALSAAHAAGVIHRDIKPENIMIRPDGVVKVLDFGLARITSDAETSGTQVSLAPAAGSITRGWATTEPGMVLGTTGYMSPEQVRGHVVDERSDVFSCGVVLYEMLAGEPPFPGETTSDRIAALLAAEPRPIDQYLSTAPPDLGRILSKALSKTRERRYSTASELCADLMELKRVLDLEVASRGLPPVDFRHSADAVPIELPVSDAPVRRKPLSTRLIATLDAMRRHAGASIAGALLLILATIVLLSYSKRTAALTNKDTILLADFVNHTGDLVFDDTLKQGLAVQLAQSPFLDILPEARTEQTLRLMGRSPDQQVTRDIAREICQRQGLKALVTGSIARFDRTYSVALEVITAERGESLAITQVEARGRDEVLTALSRAAAELRRKLGESLSTIQKFDAPLEATTSSLEALKAYSLGAQHYHRGDNRTALRFFERATELDSSFALAWLERAISHYNIEEAESGALYASRAFALRDHASELERLRIAALYHGLVTGDVEQALAALEMQKTAYPRDARPRTQLAAGYLILGEYEKAVVEAREAIALNPNSAAPYTNRLVSRPAVAIARSRLRRVGGCGCRKRQHSRGAAALGEVSRALERGRFRRPDSPAGEGRLS